MKKIISIIIIAILLFSGFGFNTLSQSKSISLIIFPFIDEYDMVIIAPNKFSTNIQPLIDHKNNRDVKTILKTTEEIYGEYIGRDEAEQIKYFIKDAIESWNISYVLLVGGANELPGRYTHIYFEYEYQTEWIFLSDLYYADIYDETLNFSSWDSNDNNIFAEYNWSGEFDKVDLYPDVYLGRLPCVNENEVTICVDKIITYETEEAYKQTWFTNLVLIGGDSLLGDEQHIDEGEYVNEIVIDNLEGFFPIKIWASNGQLNQASNINDAINNGAGFVFFNGHGNTNIWATHPHENPSWIPPGYYTDVYVKSLYNENKLPIVISDACYHCQYDVASDCFGWTFLTNPDGGGIAFLGGTDIDVSYGGVDIITKGIERLCVLMSTNYVNGDKTFGELWANGITTYMSEEMDEIDYITVEEFQPFGDPSLRISGESQPPLKPARPSGSSSGVIYTTYIYSTHTTDPDEDEIYYMFDWGDDTYSIWLGPYDSGDIVESSHEWTKKGNYEIRVKAKDVNGVLSDWSEPLTVTMPKHKSLFFYFHQISCFFERFPNSFPLIRQLLGL